MYVQLNNKVQEFFQKKYFCFQMPHRVRKIQRKYNKNLKIYYRFVMYFDFIKRIILMQK